MQMSHFMCIMTGQIAVACLCNCTTIGLTRFTEAINIAIAVANKK